MLKNKFKIIAILAIMILSLTLPIVRAENETADDVVNPDTTISESTTDEVIDPISDSAYDDSSEAVTTNIKKEEDFKRADVYLTGDDVTIDYIIDGNLFVLANNVTINSQIGGDAFICANTVTIGEQGYVFSNLFTCSKNVNINGVIYDLYSFSQNTTITGYVYRDIHVGSDTVNIFGNIGRNAYVNCENLNFSSDDDSSSQCIINGSLNYSAKQEAYIPEGTVTGETIFEQETSSDNNTIKDKIISLGTFVVTVIVIWLLCLWLVPNFLKKSPSLLTTKKILPVIGFGILSPIVGIILSIVLFILGITSTLGLLLLVVLFSLMAISTSIFIITINTIICNKLKIQKTIGIFGILIASTVVLWLISLIPYVGLIISFITVILGLGIVLSSLILKEKKV